MVLNQEQKDRAKDKRLQRKFGITLADHNARRREQNNKCKICGGALDAYGPPNVDHYHFFVRAYRHLNIPQPGMKWYGQAYNEAGKVICVRYARTKTDAIADTKQATMAWSVRGLLCFKCNKGLGYVERFFGAASNPDILLSVREYLKKRLISAVI